MVDTVCNGSKKLSTHRCSLKLDQFAGSPPCNLAVSTADCWEWRTLGTGRWLGINFNWITKSGSLHPSAGWLVMGDTSRAGPLWPMTPFNNVSSVSIHQSYHGSASNIYIKPYKLPAKTETIFCVAIFSSMLNLRFENEMNVQMNIFVGTSTTTKFLFAWT